MNLALLLPIGLAALAAALVPLLVHLARRSEQRPTVFAALQWLRRKPKPRHRIRFDEWPLLLVRLLLLALLALLLAKPVLHGAGDDRPWVVVAPGVGVPGDRGSIATPGARWHRLEPGFAPLDDPAPGGPAPAEAAARGRDSVTSLLRELDATLPPGVALTVLVPPVLDGVDAQRPRLSRRVDWRVVPADDEVDAGGVAGASTARRGTAGDQIGAKTAPKTPGRDAPSAESTDAHDARSASELLSPARTTNPTPHPSIRFAADREPALRYLRAAFAAWTPGGPEGDSAAARVAEDIAPLDVPLPPSTRALVWLAPGTVPAGVCQWIRSGGTALLDAGAVPCSTGPAVALWRDGTGAPLVDVMAHGRGRMLRLTRPLTPQAMPELLEASFPTQLRALFGAVHVPPARVLAADHVPSTGGPTFPQPPRDLTPWLVVLIALVFLVERTMATSRRRGSGP